MQVFISHAATDAKLAKRIADVLREAGLQVWDDTQILPGDNWGAKLAEALQESDAMVVLLTPNSVGSPNLNYEVGYALGKSDYKGRLIPVIAAPLGQLPKEDIPWVFHKLQMIHLSDPEKDEEGLRKIAQVLKEAAQRLPSPFAMTPHEAFLSHSSLDHGFVTDLASMLRRHGVPLWYSQTNIMGAQQWHDEIGAALRRCDWFLLVLSPNSVASMQVKRELIFALQQNGSRTELGPYCISLVILTVLLGYSPAFRLSISKGHLRMGAVAYYGYGVSATSQANKPAFSLKVA